MQLIDRRSREDVLVFLRRLARVGEPQLRLVTSGAVLGFFGCTQTPMSLLDETSLVLVTRGVRLAATPAQQLDATVELRALIDRLVRLRGEDSLVELPANQVSAPWAGVLPPRAGWQAAGVLDAASLRSVAAAGIERVAAALPAQPGEAVVRRVRAEVWGSEIAPGGVPAAAAFAAESLGFLRDEQAVRLSVTPHWLRLASQRGQVLVRRSTFAYRL